MRKLATVCLSLFFICLLNAQSDRKVGNDSTILGSRIKANVVLSKLDTIYEKKILYSLLDRDYYIIIQTGEHYNEYIARIDSLCSITIFKKVENDKDFERLKAKKALTRKDRKRLKQLVEDRQTISDAFNTSQYSVISITSSHSATYITGVPSYFVMKDEDDKIHCEYSLSSIITPCPINPYLWAYLIKKISENTK